MRSCWSGEDDQVVGGVAVTVVVRWVPGLTLGCGTRMARPVGDDWGPGAEGGGSDPPHVLRCSQGLPIGTTSPRWGARRHCFLPGRNAEPVLAPGALADSMPEVKKAQASRTCSETGCGGWPGRIGPSSLSGFCPRAGFRRIAPATCANDLPLETAGDRCEPLGSDGVWTKRGPSGPLSGPRRGSPWAAVV